MRLVKSIYRITSRFPKEDVFGLVFQMRRSAVSVPSNIAEGAARGTSKEFRQFLMVARGSLSELETQLLVARELRYVADTSEAERKIQQTLLLLNGLLRSLEAST
jgi:four helix bundle protein